MSLELKKRDFELMKAVFEHRVLTFEQLGRQFFEGRDNSTARKRINKLCKEGFLRKRTLDLPDVARRAALLSEKAWLDLQHKWGFEIENPHFQTKSPEHDVMLAEIVFRFRRLRSFKRYFSENLLQSSPALVSSPSLKELSLLHADGGLVLVDENQAETLFSVEYECSKKAPERYEEKLSSYHRTSEISGVLYVCRTREILASIARSDRAVCKSRSGFVCLALESDVLGPSERIHFPSATGEGVELF